MDDFPWPKWYGKGLETRESGRGENKKKRRTIVKWSGTEKVSWIHMASEAGLSQISNSSGV